MDFAETKRRKDATTDVLCLGWWATGGSLTSKSGLERAMSTLAAVLPEALPSRWDIDETYRHRIVDDGLKGLVEFVDAHRSWVCLRAKAPARSVQVFAVPPSQRRGEFRSTCLLVELDISVLGRRGAGKRLPGAFEQLAEVIEPFYAEARVMRGVAKHEGATARYEPGVECYPFQSNAWWGLPLKAPFAAVLGNPYRQHWPGFGTSEHAGLAIENPRPWDRDVAGLAWHVPAGLCQQFDPHMAQVQPPGGIGNFVAFQLMVPTLRAAVWPLEEPPEHVARPLSELLA